jgi:phospholipid-transporting ATPase
MDPFFDDDDDNMPDSAFGRPHPGPMDSQASGLPLARNAVPPAGSGSRGNGEGVPQGWNFDDDDFRPANEPPFAGSSSFNGVSAPKVEKATEASRKRRWKWPWQKEKVLTGERIIALNNAPANAEYGSNFVSTSKYNLASFIPKFLTGA